MGNFTGFQLLESDAELIVALPVHTQRVLRAQGSHLQLATDWEVKLGTVKSRIHRARAMLQKLRNEAEELKQ